MKVRNAIIIIFIILYSCSGNVIQTTVFTDGFDEMESGVIKGSAQGDPAIYHEPGHARSGQWTIATSLRQEGFDQAWVIREHEGQKVLVQTFENLDENNEPLSLTTHPMVVAGDTLWNDYMIEVDFTPLANFDKCGIVFGCQHPNEYYFFGTEGNTVVLKHIQQSLTPLRPIERILAYKPLIWTPGEEMHGVVTIRRNKISTILNDSIRMYEGAELVHPGRVGLISDMPAVFSRVEVKMLKGELRQLTRRRRQLNRREEIHLGGHPDMVRWKTLDIEGLGANQNLRLGDLNGDGNKELLFIAERSANMACCVTAMNLNGEILWHYGQNSGKTRSYVGELPVQVHDLDGDHHKEVLIVYNGSIRVLEGRTGELKKQVILPERIGVRSMIFGDLLGTGRDNCMILGGEDGEILVFNEKLELLWKKELEYGGNPQVHDLDGDGLDEVLSGYVVLNNDGSLMFDAGTFIGDRCNGMVVTRLVDGMDEYDCIIYAAGDWGLVYVDFEGNVIKQNILGHVRYISVADYNMEAPGLELATSNSWGSDGLLHIWDAGGELNKFLMSYSGPSRCQPVNWKGDGEEFFILNADSISGGMLDFQGEISVRFPSDGHPVNLYTVADLYGDTRDEVIVWDDSRMWIYTQDDNPRMGKTYNPSRIPLYNQSMNCMQVSEKGW